MISRRTLIALACLCLALVTVILYWPVSGHPFIAYDDGFYIVDNAQVTGGLSLAGVRWAFTTFHEANWHPLTWLSHQLDVTLYGLWAGGHHLTNLFLHTLNTLLLFLLLQRFTGAVWRSALVAALFALHPQHVESVAWVAERKDLLCSLFVMLTLHAYRCYARDNSRTAYLLALGSFGMSLLAKPMAVTLPCLLLLLDVWPLERTRTAAWWPLVREKLPFFVLTALSSLVTVIAQKSGGALIPILSAGMGPRLANAVVSTVKYLGRTVWPADLAVLYPFPASIPIWQVIGSCVLLVALLLLVWRRRQQQPYLLVGLLWFLGMLVPVSGLVQVGQQGMADRYTYLPLIGVFIALVWLAADCAKSHGVTLKVAATVSCILLAGYGLAARIQLDYWQSSESLFRRALAVTKKNYVMHLNLGNELKAKGLHDEAILEFLNAVGMQPLNPDTHYYLADGLHAAGKLEEAVAQYRVALQLKPGFPAAHNNLGATLYKQGKLAEAIIHYAEAVRLNPKDTLASLNLRETMAELAAARQTQSNPGKNR